MKHLGLSFSREKSGIMVFNDGEEHKTVSVQQVEIPLVKEYKYLGVWLNNSEDYTQAHEAHLKTKGRRNAAIMKHRALWGYSKYEVVRGVWKRVMVPGLTFANSVLCMKPETQAGLEVNQRAVGRLALGAHSKTTNEAVQGDMGWSSFEAREAQSKIKFEERLRDMEDEKWAARVFKYLYLRSVDTRWRRRTRQLTKRYGKSVGESGVYTTVKKQVKAAETTKWAQRMEAKKTLETYRAEKREIKKEGFYGNTRGSALLFEARAGCLRTRAYTGSYRQQDETCACCGSDRETIDHIVRSCTEIRPPRGEGETTLAEALGFGARGNLNFKAIEVTKRRLEWWWRKSREGMGTQAE